MGNSAASPAGGCGAAGKQPELVGHHWLPEAWARTLLAEEEEVVVKKVRQIDPEARGVVRSQSHDAGEEVVVKRKDGCCGTEGSLSRRPSPALALARRRVGVAKSKLRLKNKKRLRLRPPPLDLDALAAEVEKILRLRARTHAEQQQEVVSPPVIQPDLSACDMSTPKQIKQSGFSTAWLDELVDKPRLTHAEVVKRWPLDEKEYQKRCTITKVHQGWTTRVILPDGQPFDPDVYGTAVEVAKGVWELKDRPVDLDAMEAKLRELGYDDSYISGFREMPSYESIKGHTCF